MMKILLKIIPIKNNMKKKMMKIQKLKEQMEIGLVPYWKGKTKNKTTMMIHLLMKKIS